MILDPLFYNYDKFPKLEFPKFEFLKLKFLILNSLRILAQFFIGWLSPAGLSAGSAFLRSRLVALFSLKALRSPATLQKLLHSFSAAYALKIQRKIFAAADAPPTASAAALKLKSATKRLRSNQRMRSKKILEPSFLQPLPRILEFPRNSRILNLNSLKRIPKPEFLDKILEFLKNTSAPNQL